YLVLTAITGSRALAIIMKPHVPFVLYSGAVPDIMGDADCSLAICSLLFSCAMSSRSAGAEGMEGALTMGYSFTRVARIVQATQAAACPSGGAFRYQRLCLVLARSIPHSNKESCS